MTGSISGATAGEPARLWLESRREESSGLLRVEAYAESLSTLRVQYRIRSTKSGTSGRSTTSQSGEATLLPGTPKSLSSLNVGVREGDRYRIEAELLDGDGKPRASATLGEP